MSDYSLRYRFSASGHADVVRAFQSIGAAAAKAQAAEQRAAASAVASQSKIANANRQATVYRTGGRSNAAEREADAEAKAAKRAADAKIREHERALRHVSRIRDRHFLMEQRQAERSEQKIATKRNAQMGVIKGLAFNALTSGAGFMGAAGLAVTGAAARKEFALRSKTRDIAISTRGAGQEAADPEVLAREFQKTAQATPGQSASDIADAVKAFTTKTGDLGMARKLQGTFATLASASGAQASDVSGAAADLMQKFGIKDEGEMQDALGKLYMQGKAGSFELSDAAQKFPMMAAAAQRFGLDKGAKGVATLGGLSQIARESTGSADQAGTAVEAMFRQLVSKSGDLKSKGVDVFKKDGSARDIQDVLVDTISKVGGNDIAKKKVGLQQVFGDEGIRAISPLIDAFATAVKEGKDPVDALRSKLEGAINVTGAWADVQQDAAMAQESSGAKLSAAWESFSAQVGDAVLPSLVKMIESVTNNGTALETLAGTAGVLAEAFAATIDVLKKIPGVGEMFKEKEKGTGDLLKDAEKELEKANAPLLKGRSYESLTDEEKAKIGAANERFSSLAMVEEIQQGAAGTASEDEVRMGIESIGSMGGLSEEEKDSRRSAIVETFNAGRPDDQKLNFEAETNKLSGSAERAQAALDKFTAAVEESSSHVGSFGRGRGNPLGD